MNLKFRLIILYEFIVFWLKSIKCFLGFHEWSYDYHDSVRKCKHCLKFQLREYKYDKKLGYYRYCGTFVD